MELAQITTTTTTTSQPVRLDQDQVDLFISWQSYLGDIGLYILAFLAVLIGLYFANMALTGLRR